MKTQYLSEKHRTFFHKGKTRTLKWRLDQLTAMQTMITEQESLLCDALKYDLSKNPTEILLGEIGFLRREIAYAKKNLCSWMAPKRHSTPFFLAFGKSYTRFEPLGVGLIIGAWNYPLLLTLSPLIAAISAGNAAVIKPSEKAQKTSETLAQIIPQYLDNDVFSVVCGGPEKTVELLKERWDHIFFTGSSSTGKMVMSAAANHLTPVVLELGGKNPAIVESSANLEVAARRIVQGRFTNAGQTCTAPDYLLLFKDIADPFIEILKKTVTEFYGTNPQLSPDFGRIINTHHFDRLTSLLPHGKIIVGGNYAKEDLYFSPTIMTDIDENSSLMKDEIFGPILPIVEVSNATEIISRLNASPTPLSIYIFTENTSFSRTILDSTSSGNAVINDCTIEPLITDLPFGGVGSSGIGKYHGSAGFLSYSNQRGTFTHSTWFDPSFRYPPYKIFSHLRSFILKTIKLFF